MSTLAWVLLGLAVWTAVSVAFGLLVGAVVRLRDEREAPTGPRVRVEARTVHPWAKR